jgi:uncharacterized protein (DUF58 family)
MAATQSPLPNQTVPRRSRGAAAPSFIDPATLMRIKNLQVRAKVVVEGFYSGLHRSPYHGFSVEFSEYRQYSPGDDPRYLDWRLYARSDRYYIKRFEDETNLRCYLLVDRSRSMGFGSASYTKGEYAATTAATLAYFLAQQRDMVGLMTFDAGIVDYIPPRYRPGHLHRIMVALERELAGTATDLGIPLEQTAKTAVKRGLVVMVSDLLAPIDTLETRLGYLRSRGHEVVVFRVLDPAELEFDFDNPSMFLDLESGRELYVDPEAARAEYLRRFQEHSQAVDKACSNLGIDFYQFPIDRPLELTLFDFLHARMRRGKRTTQRRSRRYGSNLSRRPA